MAADLHGTIQAARSLGDGNLSSKNLRLHAEEGWCCVASSPLIYRSLKGSIRLFAPAVVATTAVARRGNSPVERNLFRNKSLVFHNPDKSLAGPPEMPPQVYPRSVQFEGKGSATQSSVAPSPRSCVMLRSDGIARKHPFRSSFARSAGMFSFLSGAINADTSSRSIASRPPLMTLNMRPAYLFSRALAPISLGTKPSTSRCAIGLLETIQVHQYGGPISHPAFPLNPSSLILA